MPATKDEKRVPVDNRFVVSRTCDGLSTGDAFHIVFRHALDVDETGDNLAVGSSTGGLWVTEIGDDSWTSLSQNLPQIYCVRFGVSEG